MSRYVKFIPLLILSAVFLMDATISLGRELSPDGPVPRALTCSLVSFLEPGKWATAGDVSGRVPQT